MVALFLGFATGVKPDKEEMRKQLLNAAMQQQRKMEHHM